MNNEQYQMLMNLRKEVNKITDSKTDVLIRIGDKEYDLKDIVCICSPGTLNPKIVFVGKNEPR